MSQLRVQRVVVACDAVCELTPAIETATRLAAHWHARLHGLFLEDPGLRQAAALPFVQQVTLSTGTPQSFELAEMEQAFRSISRRAERRLGEAAARLGLDWSFSVGGEVLPGSGAETDFLVLQATARPFAGQYRLPSRWSSLLYRAMHPVLLLRGDPKAGHAVVLLFEPGSKAARRSLAAAAELASINQRRLTVLARTGADAEKIRRWVAETSPSVAAQSRIELLADPAAIDDGKLAALDIGLLVLDATAGDGEEAMLERTIARTRADVLLVR